MPADIIAGVHTLSCRGQQGLEFLNRDNELFAEPAAISHTNNNDNDNDDASSYHPSIVDNNDPDEANNDVDIAGSV